MVAGVILEDPKYSSDTNLIFNQCLIEELNLIYFLLDLAERLAERLLRLLDLRSFRRERRNDRLLSLRAALRDLLVEYLRALRAALLLRLLLCRAILRDSRADCLADLRCARRERRRDLFRGELTLHCASWG